MTDRDPIYPDDERQCAPDALVRLAPESVEAVARRLAELLASPPQPNTPRRLLTAAEVSDWWGVDRSWVYAHADDLGARRLGAGPRPRLRFDPDDVTERLGAARGEPARHQGRSPPMPCKSEDSLASPSRAIVAHQQKSAGRRANAPGHGAEEMPSARP